MEYKILNLEEFQHNGPPQFTVLMRKYYDTLTEDNKTISIYLQVIPSSDKPENTKETNHLIEVTRKDKSLIKQVKRIKDNKIFSCRDQVYVTVKGQEILASIIEFKEDLRTCVIFDYELNFYDFEIDNIKSISLGVFGDEEYDYELDKELEEELQKERKEEGWISV